MRIAIRVSELANPLTGIPRYVHELVRRLPDVGRGHDFLLYSHRRLDPALDLPYPVRYVRRPLARAQAWYQLGVPVALHRDGVDLFHDPVANVPVLGTTPLVITVPDLSAFTHARMHRSRLVLSSQLLRLAVRRARRIIAISDATRTEIEHRFPAAASKVRVVHLAADPRFEPVAATDMDRVRDTYDLPRRFVLFVGTIEPRKNLARLLDAFERIQEQVPHTLAIAGGKGWKDGSIRARLQRLADAGRARSVGFVADADLPALYSAAEAFAFPSVYEGFGLPVVEAMGCGTPVLTSSVSSLPEIAGDAALLVDPFSVDDIATALRRLCLDADLRAHLRAAGLARARSFSWERTAEQTIAVYEDAMGG